MTESNSEAQQFDFWCGEWDLKWDEGGGTNSITKILDDNVILEQFDGTPSMALKGMSMSSYNVALGKWQQTWVDNQGGYLDFVGQFEDGKMTLHKQHEVDGKQIMLRMVFYNIAENELDWNWEKSEDDGQSWELQWHIHYTRRK